MSFLRVLQQNKAALISEGTTILDRAAAENRGLSAEERAHLDAVDKRMEDVHADITRAERQVERERTMKPIPGINDATPRERRDRGDGPTGFASFGEQLAAVAMAGGFGGRPVHDARLDFQAAGAGMSEGVPGDGGFLVQPDFAQDILMKTYQAGAITSRVRKVPLSAATNQIKINAVKENSRANGSRWGGVQAFWSDEGQAGTASRPQFRQIDLNLKKLIGLAYATDELLADTVALGSIIQMSFAQEMVFKVEDAIINGDGAGKPLGIQRGGSLITQAIEGTQTIANSNSFLTFNINKMWARLFAPSMVAKETAWFINQDLLPKLNTMTLGGTAAAMPIYLPPGGMSASPYATLNGRPVIPIEQTQPEGTVGDIILADFSQYLITDRTQGVEAASSVHVRFLTDEMTFRFVYRVDGSPAWNSPLTPYSGGNTQSPFIALAARS